MDLGPPMADGVVHAAYDNPRPEVTPLIPAGARRILDLGCSTGAMGAHLRGLGHVVTGIELDEGLAATAAGRLDEVIVGDLEQLAADGTDPGGPFDCIVAGDVLEHLRDPWAVVVWADSLLGPNGSMVISVPNIRHLRTLWLVFGKRYWPYEDVGIHDRTHLRFFARANLPGLLTGTSLEIVETRRTHLLVPDWSSRWNKLAPLLGDLGTLQFVFRAERTDRSP